MKKLLEVILTIFTFPFFAIARKNHQEGTLDYICRRLETKTIYPSFKIRLKNSSDEKTMYGMCNESSLAIVLQGPICTKDDMTLVTVRYYKKLSSNNVVIVSTWEDEKEELLNSLIKEGAVIVTSKKPSRPGTLNVNYQIVSSYAGIRKAKEIGVDFVAKTRTDQRIRRPYVFDSIIHMLNSFPVDKECRLSKRIVVTPTWFGNMFSPYYVSDFFYFGTVNDMLLFFDTELDCRQALDRNLLSSRIDYSKAMYPPEIYLMKMFLKNKLEYNCDDSVFSYWQALKEYFICVDSAMLDLFSEKYDYSHRDHVNYGYYLTNDSDDAKLTMKIGFTEWLSLVNGTLAYRSEYEKEAEVRFLPPD